MATHFSDFCLAFDFFRCVGRCDLCDRECVDLQELRMERITSAHPSRSPESVTTYFLAIFCLALVAVTLIHCTIVAVARMLKRPPERTRRTAEQQGLAALL